MSPKPAIILHNALLREFYMACDRCSEIWGVRMWHPLISERQILKQTQMSHFPASPSPLSPPAEIRKNKRRREPFSHQKRVKRSTFWARFLKMDLPEGNLSPLEPGSSPLQRAVTSLCRLWWRQTPVICCVLRTLRDVLQACLTAYFTKDLLKHARAKPGGLFHH